MNWEVVGVIAEVVGAAAVVISLIYLATQIRQNNKQVGEQIRALKLQAYDSSADTFSSFRLAIAASPQIASLMRGFATMDFGNGGNSEIGHPIPRSFPPWLIESAPSARNRLIEQLLLAVPGLRLRRVNGLVST